MMKIVALKHPKRRVKSSHETEVILNQLCFADVLEILESLCRPPNVFLFISTSSFSYNIRKIIKHSSNLKQGEHFQC